MNTKTPKVWNPYAWCPITKTYDHEHKEKTFKTKRRPAKSQHKTKSIPMVDIVRGRPRSERAYKQRSETRLPWIQIAKNVGYCDGGVAKKAAARHAKKFELPWPLEPTLTQGEIAYQLKAEGLTWPDVEQVMYFPGCLYTGKSIKYAKAHAKRNGYKWPPKKNR